MTTPAQIETLEGIRTARAQRRREAERLEFEMHREMLLQADLQEMQFWPVDSREYRILQAAAIGLASN